MIYGQLWHNKCFIEIPCGMSWCMTMECVDFFLFFCFAHWNCVFGGLKFISREFCQHSVNFTHTHAHTTAVTCLYLDCQSLPHISNWCIYFAEVDHMADSSHYQYLVHANYNHAPHDTPTQSMMMLASISYFPPAILMGWLLPLLMCWWWAQTTIQPTEKDEQFVCVKIC